MRLPLQLLFLQILLCFPALLSAYEAPEDKEDVFAKRACPAFLVFNSAAYLEDMTVELPCRCKPEEAHSVVWYYQKHLRGDEARVLTDFEGTVLVDSSRVGRGTDLRTRFSIRLFSLLIFRAQEADSGHYLCGTASGQFFYGYDIDVQRARRVSFPRRRPGGRARDPPRPERGAEGPYRTFTSFWPWSVCDRCGVRGEQTRVGLCYLQSDYLSVRYVRGQSSRAAAPCGSAAVPARFRLGEARGKEGAELAVRDCHAPCPPEPAATVERETLLEFLGYDATAPQAAVYYHNHPAGSALVLACPGAQPQHAVAWDRGREPLYRARHMEGLNRTARVYIDAGHHLHLRPARLEDKGSYYCWVQGRRAAEIRLGVYLRLGRTRQVSDPESVHALRALGLCYAAYALLFLLYVLLRLSWRSLKRKRL
ncbi:Ig-like V-type domain-containing protein FAM187A [Anguilla anguilla]|uniref:Ig-like V-type domain-containing protein FAM187A n=1 Tax=Anguilla anguilla TaxID=7936 RepID=UPI0015A9663B|nr:Ig-like V-type domain-containing protein FAM187A [Anguilla anguilla]